MTANVPEPSRSRSHKTVSEYEMRVEEEQRLKTFSSFSAPEQPEREGKKV